ncbi:MAG: outer membrane beta-barrel protein [Planctomycetota bacterium]
MFRRWTGVLIVFGLILALSAPAVAQVPEAEGADATEPGAEVGTPPGDEEQPPDEAKPEEEETLPTYEEPTMTLPPGEETPQSAFLRLAEFSIRRTELGATGPGRLPIWPRGALKLGPATFFPYGGVSIGFSSNVFQEENRDKDASWFGRAFAGIASSYPFLGGRANFDVGADVSYWEYFEDDVKDYWEWVGGASITWRFYRGFWVQGGVKWEHLVDPVGVEFVGELERDQFYPFVDFGFADALGNKIKLEFGFDYHTVHFKEEEFETGDRDEFNVWAKVSAPFVKDKSRIYVRYNYRWTEADSERINDLENGHEVSGGIDGAIPLSRTERLTGFIEAGYRYDIYESPREYSDGTETQTTDDSRRNDGVTVAAGLRWLAGPRTSTDLRLLRTFQFSTRGNYQVVSRVDLSLTHNVTKVFLTRVGIFAERDDPSEGEISSRYGGGVGGRYKIDDNLDVDASVDYSRTDTRGDGADYAEVNTQLGLTLYFR